MNINSKQLNNSYPQKLNSLFSKSLNDFKGIKELYTYTHI